ncbi:MAG: universal stress protein [Sandaracinaceae bacterium]
MTSFKTLLCAVDFSDTSEHAASYAARLAKDNGATLHFMHVFELPMLALPDGAVLPTPEWTAGASDKLQRALSDLARRYGSGLTVETHLIEGLPGTEIDRVARDIGADAVIVGTHGRSGIAHLFLGSVAERIIRASSVPVIAVPSKSA